MEIRRIENPEGALIRIELSHTGDGNFKDEVTEWVQRNYPDWGHEGFFQRLAVFQASFCTIDMR